MEKERADLLLVYKGFVDSREKGKRLIMTGNVFVGSERIEKPGQQINVDADLRVKGEPLKYVSRGGLKLEKIIECFDIDIKDKICMDVGASTGGFTDCMLQHGAKKVYSIDVGTNQLAYKLRIDPRVIVREKCNFRNIDISSIPEQVDFISIDVSFISLELILPNAKKMLKNDGSICALIKPQFEAGKDKVGKNGIVREKSTHYEVVNKILEFANSLGLYIKTLTYSPIRGAGGNIEFLALFEKMSDSIENKEIDLREMIKIIIDMAHELG